MWAFEYIDLSPLTTGQAPSASKMLRVGLVMYKISSWWCLFRNISLWTLNKRSLKYYNLFLMRNPNASWIGTDRWRAKLTMKSTYCSHMRLRTLNTQMLREKERLKAEKFTNEVAYWGVKSFPWKVFWSSYMHWLLYQAGKSLCLTFFSFYILTCDHNIEIKSWLRLLKIVLYQICTIQK